MHAATLQQRLENLAQLRLTIQDTALFRINIDLDPPNLEECTKAFNGIVAKCDNGSPDFGGWWSKKLESSYSISNFVYREDYPHTNSVSSSVGAGSLGVVLRAVVFLLFAQDSSSTPSSLQNFIEREC